MKEDSNQTNKIIDIIIRLISLGLIVYLCISILKPFIIPVFWSIIFAVALDPMYRTINQHIGNKRRITSIILVLSALSIMSLPIYLFLE